MKKTPSLFMRNYDGDRLVRDEVVPAAAWVIAGEGVATLKIDGTSCLVRDGLLYKRFDCRKGKTEPPGFVPAQEADPITGNRPGWLPVGYGPEDHWHQEGMKNYRDQRGAILSDWTPTPDWTYELIGPKVQGNPYNLNAHMLTPHGEIKVHDAPRTFDELRAFFAERMIEGIVWWKDPTDMDCEKVKVKRKDFGFPWPEKRA